MANIKLDNLVISEKDDNIKKSGIELFSDSENFLAELDENDSSNVMGGLHCSCHCCSCHCHSHIILI